jgi:hypothetical protein
MDEGARQTAAALGYGQPGGAPTSPEPVNPQQMQTQQLQQPFGQQYPQQ